MDEIEDQTRWLGEQAPRLILFARQWVPCHADAEDVFHTAFIRFWRDRNGVRDPTAYLYACVRTVAISFHRAGFRRSMHERAARTEPLFASDSDELIVGETNQAIENAVRALPDELREVVVMRIWGELTFPQIGDVLSISPSTADTRYRAGLKQLRLALKEKVES